MPVGYFQVRFVLFDFLSMAVAEMLFGAIGRRIWC